uniref:Uncharacterized protein n=1 Tax=Romanomermis culicivorax TaxID=13658 RepID=A0A915K2C9_ROMCU
LPHREGTVGHEYVQFWCKALRYFINPSGPIAHPVWKEKNEIEKLLMGNHDKKRDSNFDQNKQPNRILFGEISPILKHEVDNFKLRVTYKSGGLFGLFKTISFVLGVMDISNSFMSKAKSLVERLPLSIFFVLNLKKCKHGYFQFATYVLQSVTSPFFNILQLKIFGSQNFNLAPKNLGLDAIWLLVFKSKKKPAV